MCHVCELWIRAKCGVEYNTDRRARRTPLRTQLAVSLRPNERGSRTQRKTTHKKDMANKTGSHKEQHFVSYKE